MLNALKQPPTLGAGPGTVGGLGTTAKIFPYNSTNNVGIVGQAFALPIDGSGRLDGISFSVRASGRIFTNQAMNMTVTAFGIAGAALPSLATQLTPGSYTILGASTARASGGQGTFPFSHQMDLHFDSVGGKVQGTFSVKLNNSFDAPAALTNQLSGITNLTEPSFWVVIGITFSVTDALNLATMLEFGMVPS